MRFDLKLLITATVIALCIAYTMYTTGTTLWVTKIKKVLINYFFFYKIDGLRHRYKLM